MSSWEVITEITLPNFHVNYNIHYLNINLYYIYYAIEAYTYNLIIIYSLISSAIIILDTKKNMFITKYIADIICYYIILIVSYYE